MPGSFLDDDPSQMVRVRIEDKDGGYSDLSTTIPVDNVAPVVDAGPDRTAFAGTTFLQSISITDPGDDHPWTVDIDWDGDSTFEQTTSTSTRNFAISHMYGTADEKQDTVTVRIDDRDGGAQSDMFDVIVADDTLRVLDFTPFASGFDVRFNHPPDLAGLNLYDGLDAPVELPDLTLVGASVGPVAGSLVCNESNYTHVHQDRWRAGRRHVHGHVDQQYRRVPRSFGQPARWRW